MKIMGQKSLYNRVDGKLETKGRPKTILKTTIVDQNLEFARQLGIFIKAKIIKS